MEAEDSRDPPSPEPGDPAPQKKKRKKRTLGRCPQGGVRLRQSPDLRLHLPGQDPDNLDVANGNADGEDEKVSASRRTRRTRSVLRPGGGAARPL